MSLTESKLLPLYGCPDCDSTDSLEVCVTAWYVLDQSDPGNLQTCLPSKDNGGHDWDYDAGMVCTNCRWDGTVEAARKLLHGNYDIYTDDRVRDFLDDGNYDSVEDWARDSQYHEDPNSITGWVSNGMVGFGPTDCDIYSCIVDAAEASGAFGEERNSQ